MSSRCREAVLAFCAAATLVAAIDYHYWTAADGEAALGVISAAHAQAAQRQGAKPQATKPQDANSPEANSQATPPPSAQPPAAQEAQAHEGPAPVRLRPIVQGPTGPVPGPMRGSEPAVPNPYQGDPGAMLAGRRMFVAMNCSGCHGGHAGGGMGPSLRDQTWIYGKRPMDIFDSISNGRANGMPSWGTLLPQQQIWQIVAYIQSMRTPQEPEPPE